MPRQSFVGQPRELVKVELSVVWVLARQGEELSVVALASDADAETDAAAAAGPDEDDRAALERRLEDLDAEIEESARWNDLARGERARREREELGVELAAALGLGAADRRAGASAERARFSVTKARVLRTGRASFSSIWRSWWPLRLCCSA